MKTVAATASALASYTTTSRPSMRLFSAILEPMWPTPTKPTGGSEDAAAAVAAVLVLTPRDRDRAARRAARAAGA